MISRRIKTILICFLFLNIYFPEFPKKVFAADLTVDCSKNLCTKTGTDPLFNKNLDGYWFPGRTLTKTVLFKNSSNQAKLISVQAKRTSLPSPLEKVMQLRITDGDKIVWVGNLSDFYSREKIDLDNFTVGSFKEFAFSLSLSKDLGQEYSNLETVFDLEMGFWEENVLGEKTRAQKGFSWWQWFLLPFPLLTLILFFSLLLGL